MHKIKEHLLKELKEFENHDKLTMSDLEIVHKITDTIKNIDKIEMLEDGTYSHDGGDREARGSYRNDGMMPGTSQRRQRRDIRGRYSRDGGGYSYDDGKEELHELLDELEKDADERMKNAIYRFKQEIRR